MFSETGRHRGLLHVPTRNVAQSCSIFDILLSADLRYIHTTHVYGLSTRAMNTGSADDQLLAVNMY